MKVTFALILLTLAPTILAADLELKNPDFEKGKQFWRGDGKVVTIDGGAKVLELKGHVESARREVQGQWASDLRAEAWRRIDDLFQGGVRGVGRSQAHLQPQHPG